MRVMTSLGSRSGRVLAWLVGCGIVLSLFASCKIVDEPFGPPEPEAPQVYLAGLSDLGAGIEPEAATWRMGDDTSETRLVRDRNGAVVAARAVLDSAPEDTVRVDLRRAGVRFGRATYLYRGAPTLERLGYRGDGLAEGILAKMGASTSPDSFEATLAEALVKGDSLFDDHPYPAGAPEGLDTAAVTRFVVLELVETEKPFGEAVAAGALRLDTNGLKTRIRQLADSGVVKDTSKIFPPLPPPPPPQDRTPPSVRIVSPTNDGVLPFGQDVFAVVVRADDSSGIDSVWIAEHPAGRRAGDWVLEDLASPAPGETSRVVVRAKDRAGNVASDSVLVRREADMVGPVVSVASPSDGALLPFESDSVPVKVSAKDASGVDSVRVSGAPAVLVDGFWIAKVSVPVGPTRIDVRAVDRAGNVSSGAVSVERASPPRDTLAPSIRVLAPLARDLPYDSLAATISVVVVDRGGLASVRVGDSSMPVSDSVFSRRVDLRTGVNVFALVAEDRSGNRAVDSVVLERSAVPPPDTTAPALARGRGAVSRVVPFDSIFALVAWNASDDRKLSEVRIGDTLVAGDKGVYFRALPLRVGVNVVVARAVDSSGNSTVDSVAIVREQDTTHPVVVRAAGAEVWLPLGSSGTTVSWKVHDNLPTKVTIGGTPVSGVDSVYSLWVVVAGPSVAVTIEAKDEAGNATSDVVVVRRVEDNVAPQLLRNAGTNDTTVSGETAEWIFGWVVRDNSSLKSVEICGIQNDLGASDSSFGGKAGLVDGVNVIWIKAVDVFENAAVDTIRVTRLSAASGSPRTSSGAPAAARKAPSIVVFVAGKEPE